MSFCSFGVCGIYSKFNFLYSISGFIDEEQWAQFVLQLPRQEIKNLVTFHVLPPDIRPTTPNRCGL